MRFHPVGADDLSATRHYGPFVGPEARLVQIRSGTGTNFFQPSRAGEKLVGRRQVVGSDGLPLKSVTARRGAIKSAAPRGGAAKLVHRRCGPPAISKLHQLEVIEEQNGSHLSSPLQRLHERRAESKPFPPRSRAWMGHKADAYGPREKRKAESQQSGSAKKMWRDPRNIRSSAYWTLMPKQWLTRRLIFPTY